MRNVGFLLRDIKPVPLLFTIPAMTDIHIVNTHDNRSKVELTYAGRAYTAWINNEDIALDTMNVLEGGVL